MDESFDAVVIGAGMSGFAAGIRLALAGKSVVILERHYAPGGLNSFYSKDGRRYDVGLHAMTNFSPATAKGTPLAKVFRQLRIHREEIDLYEQTLSHVIFPDVRLGFSNQYSFFESEVARCFPKEIDHFRRLVAFIREYPDTDLNAPALSAHEELSVFIKDPLLRDMLLCPIMYYGSAAEHDMDFTQFVTLFKGIFIEGFSRPFGGVRSLIKVLQNKYKELGGHLRLRCGVKQIEIHDGNAVGVTLDNGTFFRAKEVFSSAGLVETVALCSQRPEIGDENDITGKLSFTESIALFEGKPADFDWQDTVVFFSHMDAFQYRSPDDPVDLLSGVICLPDNYRLTENSNVNEGCLRVTALANYGKWAAMEPGDYAEQKTIWFDRVLENALTVLGGNISSYAFRQKLLASDMFTPKTIERYTWHKNGTVYGSPIKVRDGNIGVKHLHICGTDQGFHGIVGAMLSGITIANRTVL